MKVLKATLRADVRVDALSDPWVWKTRWRKKWLPTPVFLLEDSMIRGAFGLRSVGWQTRTQLSDQPFHFLF